MGLMQSALGNQLTAFFTGEKSAADTLAAVEADYIAGAREAGKYRSEGKDYVVHDGDVMLFRFNV
jgi:ribosome-binding ATPase YchF (GTP1/OBG family)